MFAAETGSWEAAYRERPSGSYGRPGRHRPIVEPLPELFAANGVKRVLDIGCGDGAHLYFFAKAGFEVCGLDSAPTALRLAKEWLEREGLACELKLGEMAAIPWEDEVFDAVIATNSFDHNDAAGGLATASEVYRVLSGGGLFFANTLRYMGSGVAPAEAMADREPTEVEPRTLVPALGHDRGVPHHWFTEDELRRVLGRFEIVNLEADAKFVFLARKPEGAA